MSNLFCRERIRLAERFLKGDMEPTFEFCICGGKFPLSKREHIQFLCMNQGGNAGKARSLFRGAGFLYFLKGGRLTMAKEQVQAITKMEEDFAQWYTDIVKKLNLLTIQV